MPYEDSKDLLATTLSSMDRVQLRSLIEGVGTTEMKVERESLSVLQPTKDYKYVGLGRYLGQRLNPYVG